MLSGAEQILSAIDNDKRASAGLFENVDNVRAEIHLKLLSTVEVINKHSSANHKVSLEDLIARGGDYDRGEQNGIRTN